MIIPDKIRNCVAFLFSDFMEGGVRRRRPVGTAFLIDFEVAPDTGFVYAVTARHVIEGTRPNDNLSIRFNREEGGYEDYWAPHESWWLHPRTDVAVAPLTLPWTELDIRWFPQKLVATNEFIKYAEITEGHEVFFAGLFAQHFGKTRSHPVLRFGNIALMPHEPVLVKIDPAPDALPVEVDAYLVEARSWGGLSGSPVFAGFDMWRPVATDPEGLKDGRPRLLGLVHGHFNVPESVTMIGAPDVKGVVPINAGMAIVIPAQKILDILMMEDVVEEREKEIAKHDRENLQPATPDTSLVEELSEYERFETLAETLIRVPKSELDDERKKDDD